MCRILEGFLVDKTTLADVIIGELKKEISDGKYSMSEEDSCMLIRAVSVFDFPESRLEREDPIIPVLVSRLRAAGLSEYGRKDSLFRFLYGVKQGDDMKNLLALARKL